jgi:DNA-binding transcriptional ArsR family regulator
MADVPPESPAETADPSTEAAESAGGAESATDAEPARVVGADSEVADDLIAALSSGTAREVLAALHEEPAAPSELADRLDASLQTVHYHVENLADADVIEVVDTATSEKGREMDVYGPAGGPVVVFAGDGGVDDLRRALSRLASAFGVLALASLLVQEVIGDGIDRLFGAEEPTPGQMETLSQSAGEVGGLEPGVAFFAGGAAVLLAGFAVRYWRHRRD